jgi:hypothetical protein
MRKLRSEGRELANHEETSPDWTSKSKLCGLVTVLVAVEFRSWQSDKIKLLFHIRP